MEEKLLSLGANVFYKDEKQINLFVKSRKIKNVAEILGNCLIKVFKLNDEVYKFSIQFIDVKNIAYLFIIFVLFGIIISVVTTGKTLDLFWIIIISFVMNRSGYLMAWQQSFAIKEFFLKIVR